MLNIMWFRQDLRIADNPALTLAAQDANVLPIYILDDETAGSWKMGGASRVWLHHSLISLNKALDNRLLIFAGDAQVILPRLARTVGTESVCWNRCYEPWRIKRDKQIKQDLISSGIEVLSENASLLWEPWEILKQDGTPYKVYTPYFQRGCLAASPPRPPLKKPVLNLVDSKSKALQSGIEQAGLTLKTIEELNLLPDIPWHKGILETWQIGEDSAKKKARAFVKSSLAHYKEGRDFPSANCASRLSPHLHFGEISPHQAWQLASKAPAMDDENNRRHFLSELGWREFSYYLLYHWPSFPDEPFNKKYKRFPWSKSKKQLRAWQSGATGYPLVDAGMRELWQTGFMHNRVRMVVASFLVKNQLIPWQEGEAWFWDCLVDADLAANSASWQWAAGCGADAAPYFRIFNPVTQSEKFDPDAEYIKRFCPELAGLPTRYIHKPWLASEQILKDAGVVLGDTYPRPILDLKQSRERALQANRSLA